MGTGSLGTLCLYPLFWTFLRNPSLRYNYRIRYDRYLRKSHAIFNRLRSTFMNSASAGTPERITMQIDFTSGRYELHAQVVVPNRPTALGDIIPLAQALADQVTNDGAEYMAAHG